MTELTLWGFDGSTYVRTVKMLLAEKGVTDFKQVPLNVLAGDPKSPEHLERHPFGKVPVLDQPVKAPTFQKLSLRRKGIADGRKLMAFAMKTRGSSPFVAGDLSLADLYLAPILFYVTLTPDKDAVLDVEGLREWWDRVQALPSYKSTEPKLG